MFSGLRSESLPKRSLAPCKPCFVLGKTPQNTVSHRARDCFGTLAPEARKHLSHSPLSTFGHFGCFDTCVRPAGSQPNTPKRTRNRPETEPNGAKRTRNGPKRSRNGPTWSHQALWGWNGQEGLSGWGVGVVREKENQKITTLAPWP